MLVTSTTLILIDLPPDRLATPSPVVNDVSVVVVVYTWKGGESIFSGQLSHVSQLEPPTYMSSE